MNYEPKALDFSARYGELCALRDQVNAQNAPLEVELAEACAQMEVLRLKAEKLAGQIDDNRGREKWIAMKKEIGQLAKALSGRKTS